jgi:hypothetical protein
MQLRLLILVATVLLSFGSACGEEDASGRPAPTVIDELAVTVNGVGLGDDRTAIRRELGPARTEGLMLPRLPDDVPLEDIGLPWTLDPLPGVPRTRVQTMLYDGMSFLVAPREGAYAFFVWRPRARTTSGVRIGDSLESAVRRHPRLRCGVRNRATEYVAYPYCKGRVGDNYVWFGQDPIRSITVSATPLG